jgi:hypothetical protein
LVRTFEFRAQFDAGLFMLLCFTLFAARRRFPAGLLALFLVQVLLEEPARLLVSPEWRSPDRAPGYRRAQPN